MGALVRSTLLSPPGRRAGAAAARSRLTTMLYHRLGDAADPSFEGDPALLSATPDGFEQQVRFLDRNFSVVSLDDLRDHVVDGRPLPDRPAVITFDDGYRDNFTEAVPVLRRAGLPAVIFVTTGFVGSDRRPWWDELTHLFARTARPRAELPLCGSRDLTTPEQRDAARHAVSTRIKEGPHAGIDDTLDAVASALEVARPGATSRRLFMTWDEVAEAEASGVRFEPHTDTHPILTRLPAQAAREEIVRSAELVAERLGRPPMAFAYPNGRPQDIDETARRALRDLGIPLAFTASRGSARLGAVRERPLDIARINVDAADDMQRFAFKALGFATLVQGLRGR